MSRRKQAKPQHVESDINLTRPDNIGDAYLYSATPTPMDSHSVPGHTHVCSRCCAEFTELSDLEEHHRDCSPNQLVLIVNEKEESYAEMFSVGSLSPSTPGEQSETVNFSNVEMEEINDLEDRMEESEECMDFLGCKSSHHSQDRPSSTSSSTSNGSSTESMTDNISCTSVLPTSLPQPGNPSEQGQFSWTNSNVVIENLESTKVAVAQFSQLSRSDVHSGGDSKMSVSSLMEQLLGLQLQQIHQLQMIDQIRHQVLLFASQRLEISETPSSCPRDTTSSKQANQLKALSSHLSQQLATAAGLAQSLTSQSASIGHFKQLTATVQLPQSNLNGEITLSSSEPLISMGKLVTSAVSKQLARKRSTFASSLYPQLSFLAQTKLSCQALGTERFQKSSNNSSLPQPSPSNQTAANSTPGISGIVEDLNALTALTQQKKGKSTNLTVFEPKSSSKEAFFKHKCRFCAKVFGSDSALQIHLRSHTGERPYKCNICGNRFSTRGNLKVHFQRHKERYPHIQMNPYPVPEHLDNIPTSTGIPYGMSMPLEKPVTCWLDSKPPLTNLTTSAGLLLPPASPKLLSLIKKEEQQVHITTPSTQGVRDFGALAKKTDKSTDFAETANSALPTPNPKSEDMKPPLNFVSKMTAKAEGSSDNLITAIQSVGTNHNKVEQFKAKYSISGTHPLQTSETSKLQRLVENIDKKVSDPNECIICHRILSCQSALKMHYRTHTGERPYRCRVCGRSFSTKGNLKTHHAVHRATPPLRVQHSCPICQRKFTNAMVLQQHIRMHTGGQIPNVPLLDQSYLKSMESEDLEKFCDDDDDMEDITDRGITGMSRFNFSSGHLSPLSSDNMGAGSFDAHKTCYHGLVGERKGSWLKTEGRTEEGNQVYNSSSLGGDKRGLAGPETTTSNQSLSPHKNASVHQNLSGLEDSYHAHLNSRPLQLNTTGISSLDLKPLSQLKDPSDMILRERGIFRNTACDICGKTFACQSALDIHYRSHTKERPFICTACNRGFSTKGNLKQHMLTHQMRDLPSQLFEPSNASLASSPNPSVLSMAPPIAIKSEVNGFLSTSYGKGRNLSGGLRTSSISAPPVVATPPPRRTPKQHYCQTCGKTFSSSSALQIHERTHTGEKPFACTVCGRAFTTKGNLKVHMGTHMWNSTPTRRGRRLSVEGPLTFMGTHSVKLPEPPQRDTGVRSSNGESLYFWTQYTDSLSKTMTTRTNDVSVIQTGGMPYLSGPVGHKGGSPVGDITVGLNKLHHKDHNSSLIMLGKTTVERRSNFCFTRLIEERKEMIAN